MKKFLKITLIISGLLFLSTNIFAEDRGRIRKKFFHIGYNQQKYSTDITDYNAWTKCEYGVSITNGTSYYLHKKGIGKCLYFAIDATWTDISYYMYKPGENIKEHIEDNSNIVGSIINNVLDLGEIENNHQVNIGMQVGPSIHIHLPKGFQIEGYFRYAPTFSMMYDGDFMGNYATYFVGGGAISWKFIGIGAEAKFGNCKYKVFTAEDETDEDNILNFLSFDDRKTKFKGFNAFISFRF